MIRRLGTNSLLSKHCTQIQITYTNDGLTAPAKKRLVVPSELSAVSSLTSSGSSAAARLNANLLL